MSYCWEEQTGIAVTTYLVLENVSTFQWCQPRVRCVLSRRPHQKLFIFIQTDADVSCVVKDEESSSDFCIACIVFYHQHHGIHTCQPTHVQSNTLHCLCCLLPPTPRHTHLSTNTCTVKHTTLSVLSSTTNTTAYTPVNQHMYSQTHYTACIVFYHQHHGIHTCQPTHVQSNTLHCLCCLLPPTPRHTHLTTNTCTVKHTTLSVLSSTTNTTAYTPVNQRMYSQTHYTVCVVFYHQHHSIHTWQPTHVQSNTLHCLCCLPPPTPRHTHLTTNTCTVKHTTLSVLSSTTNTTAYTPDNQHMYSQTHYTVCVVFYHQHHGIHTWQPTHVQSNTLHCLCCLPPPTPRHTHLSTNTCTVKHTTLSVLSSTTNTTAYTPVNQHMYSQTHYTVCVVFYHQHHGIHTCQPTHVKSNTLHCLCCLLPPTPRHTHLSTNTCKIKHTTLSVLSSTTNTTAYTPDNQHIYSQTHYTVCVVFYHQHHSIHTWQPTHVQSNTLHCLCCLLPPTPQHTHLSTNTCTIKHTTLSVLSSTTNTTAYTPVNQHMYSQTHYTVCVVFYHQHHSIHTWQPTHVQSNTLHCLCCLPPPTPQHTHLTTNTCTVKHTTLFVLSSTTNTTAYTPDNQHMYSQTHYTVCVVLYHQHHGIHTWQPTHVQ